MVWIGLGGICRIQLEFNALFPGVTIPTQWHGYPCQNHILVDLRPVHTVTEPFCLEDFSLDLPTDKLKILSLIIILLLSILIKTYCLLGYSQWGWRISIAITNYDESTSLTIGFGLAAGFLIGDTFTSIEDIDDLKQKLELLITHTNSVIKLCKENLWNKSKEVE